MTLTAPPSVRSPLPVRVAAGLLVPVAAVSMFGAVMFGFVWGDNELGTGVVFTAFALAAAATALASIPALLRGALLGWAIAFVWSCCFTYWSVYKVFAEEEYESTPFLVGGAALVALLATRSARTHAGVAR